MLKYILAVAAAAVLMTSLAPQAEARRWVGIGLNIGIPIYPRPYYAPYYYPYYPPYPAYVAPAPVYVAPAPVYVQPSLPPPQPVPVVRPFEARGSGYEETVPPPKALEVAQGDTNRFLQQLSNQDERARGDAAIELGRMRAQLAIVPLCTMLASDRSPAARESAARALGLIGNARALNALQNAAQVDSDRDVRRSAGFSADVIRTNLRKD